MLPENEKHLLCKLVGVTTAIHRMPLCNLCDYKANRLYSVRWWHTMKCGLPELATGRTDRRTIDGLLERGLMEAHGSTKDRSHRLTLEGIFTAWSLHGDTPSILNDALAMLKTNIRKNVATFEKCISAFPYSRKSGFPPAFTALELLGAIKITWDLNYQTREINAYSAQITANKFTFPDDSHFEVMDSEEASGLFFEGLEIGKEIAESELPKIYKNEIGGLTVNRVKKFRTAQLQSDFEKAKGLWKLQF